MKQTLVLLVLLLLPLVAGTVEINISEQGKITSFYDQYYIYRINGSVTITNPSNFSLFNIDIPMYLSTLSLRTNYSSPTSYITESQIYMNSLASGDVVTFYYELLGISTEDLSTNGNAILYNGIHSLQPRIYSNLFGTLKKAPLEDSAITGRDARLISVELRNPTEFDYKMTKIDVIKTLENNPNAEITKWSFAQEKSALEAHKGWDFDFIDTDAHEGEIYWLNTDIFIENIFLVSNENISRFTQDDLFEILTNESLNITINASLDFLADRVYVRKFVSSTLVNPGDIINVTLLVNNMEPRSIDFTAYDIFPGGFEFLRARDGGSVVGSNVSWSTTLSSGTGKRLEYSLRYADDDAIGVDYFRPAVVLYDDKKFYSQSIPFVRKYIPEKKVFVQKSVKFLTGDEVLVEITVQNLGEASLKNLVVKEYLLSTAEFREISMQPSQRGVWNIDELKMTEQWQTSYVTDRASVLNTMPEIYGVPQGSILQTIILANLISSSFSLMPTNIVEIIGIVLLVIIVILYFVPHRFFSRKKHKQARELSVMSVEIDKLREKTGTVVVQKEEPLHPPKTLSTGHHLPDAQREARHKAVDEAAELLSKSMESLGVKKNKGQEKQEESQ